MDKRISESHAFVEATSFEQHCLWLQYPYKEKWLTQSMGFSIIVGYIASGKRPVNVSFTFVTINGKLICFYDTISRYNDATLVTDWIKENGNEPRIIDAQNFQNVL